MFPINNPVRIIIFYHIPNIALIIRRIRITISSHIITYTIESFWAIVKRGIKGQFYFVSPKYLSMYLDEFSFRFNNKESEFMFDKLLINAVK